MIPLHIPRWLPCLVWRKFGQHTHICSYRKSLQISPLISFLIHFPPFSFCSSFAELCESSKQISGGTLAEQFLQLYQRIQQAHSTLNSLDSNYSHKKNNATSWIEAAIATNLSNFNLFKSKDKLETQARDRELYVVVIENAVKKLDIENSSPKPSPPNPKNHPPDLSTSNKLSHSYERKEWRRGNGLEDAMELARELLSVSCRWFMKYLEDLLGDGFKLSAREEKGHEIVHLLRQLKKVNQWMNDLIENKVVERDDQMEQLRKKLYKFLLDHVDVSTRPSW